MAGGQLRQGSRGCWFRRMNTGIGRRPQIRMGCIWASRCCWWAVELVATRAVGHRCWNPERLGPRYRDGEFATDTDLLVVAADQRGRRLGVNSCNHVMVSGLELEDVDQTDAPGLHRPSCPTTIADLAPRSAKTTKPCPSDWGTANRIGAPMPGCTRLSKTWPWLSSPETTAFRQPPAFTPPRPQRKP